MSFDARSHRDNSQRARRNDSKERLGFHTDPKISITTMIARIPLPVCLRKSLRRGRRLSFSPEISEIFEPKNFLFDRTRISLKSSIIGKAASPRLPSISTIFHASSYNFDECIFVRLANATLSSTPTCSTHTHIEFMRVQ